MVNLPPLMEPEEGKREEIEQAASESRHLADELAGMLDQLEIEEERSAAVNVENYWVLVNTIEYYGNRSEWVSGVVECIPLRLLCPLEHLRFLKHFHVNVKD